MLYNHYSHHSSVSVCTCERGHWRKGHCNELTVSWQGNFTAHLKFFSIAKGLHPSSQLDGRHRLRVETIPLSSLFKDLLWSARSTVDYKNGHLFTYLALFVSASGSYGEDRPVGTMTTHQTQSNSALYQWLSNSVQKWVPFINRKDCWVSGLNVTNKRPITGTSLTLG